VNLVPLSEEEQRVLDEIERQFYANDPTFIRTAHRSAPAAVSSRRIGRGIVGLVVGLGVLLFGFMKSPFLGFVGFLLMLAGTLSLYAAMRRSGGGLASFGQRLVPNSLRETLQDRRRPRS
jgi:hypothetical protein